jgi:hypothetical protein
MTPRAEIPDLPRLTLENLNGLLRICGAGQRAAVQGEIDRRTGRAPSIEASRSSIEGKASSLEGSEDPFAGAEKDEQREIRRIFLRRGAVVYWLSQARKTGQTPGVPDLLAFDPFRGLVFIEVKGAGGKARPEQLEFRELCLAAGVHHVLGGVQAVKTFLLEESDAGSK